MSAAVCGKCFHLSKVNIEFWKKIFIEAGRPTVLVLGHSDYNLLKIAFVERLVNDTTNVEKAFGKLCYFFVSEL